MPDSEITLLPGAAGWVQARFHVGAAYRRLFVRFEPDAKGRWRPAEWSIPGNIPIEELSRVPWKKIVLAVQADDHARSVLTGRLGEEAEDGFRQAYGQPRRGEPMMITRPPGRRLNDSFYERVGVVYRQAIGRGLKPRQAIADAAGVSPDVAGRWIYQARLKGKIPKTSPGKVTA